ncbi:MAG: hypothetical protein IPM51_13765 [Sphingobacteriaceae bacterium]|nr:hypothetical protein [Sphingobacteriaceae bacterium]
MKRNSPFLLFVFLMLKLNTFSQELIYHESPIGFNFGGVFSVGSHVQRLGLTFNFFYVNDRFQMNSEARLQFNLKNLGPSGYHPEFVLSQGVLFAYGAPAPYANPFLSTVSNQTKYQNSLGYAYHLWFTPKKIKTTQQTGIISIQFNQISFITENDILARPLLDRFRTGAFLIQYQHDTTIQAGINCTMWTGQMGKTLRNVEGFPGPGYMDTTGSVHGNKSHGLLSLQAKYHFVVSQIIQANIGVDAEQIRNAVQNRIIHDVCWLPKSWFKRYNCHIPMLDSEGKQYLYKPEQKIKKVKPYWGLSTNSNLFY